MSMHLIVQEVPEQPKSLRINSQQSRSLQLTWTQPFAGNSPIEEYNIQYKSIADTWQTAERISVTGSQSVININNLHPATTYHIRIAAENKLGISDFSEMVQVTTLEEVPSGSPRNGMRMDHLLFVCESPKYSSSLKLKIYFGFSFVAVCANSTWRS